MPQTRPIALPAALLLATASLAFTVASACAFLLALIVIAGDASVVLHDAAWAAWCGAAACACATVAG